MINRTMNGMICTTHLIFYCSQCAAEFEPRDGAGRQRLEDVRNLLFLHAEHLQDAIVVPDCNLHQRSQSF